jgi:hypothetical protein
MHAHGPSTPCRWLETKAPAGAKYCISSTSNSRTLWETSHKIHYCSLANADSDKPICPESLTRTRFSFPNPQSLLRVRPRNAHIRCAPEQAILYPVRNKRCPVSVRVSASGLMTCQPRLGPGSARTQTRLRRNSAHQRLPRLYPVFWSRVL